MRAVCKRRAELETWRVLCGVVWCGVVRCGVVRLSYLKGEDSGCPSGSSGFVPHPLKYFLFFYLKVQDYLRRFESIPDMLELDHLTVSGDVTFGKNVSLKGTVIIIANHGDRIDIPPGAMWP